MQGVCQMKTLLEQLGWVVAPEVPEPPRPQEPQDGGDDDAEYRRIFTALENPVWLLERGWRTKPITIREIAKLARASEGKVSEVISSYASNHPRFKWMFRL